MPAQVPQADADKALIVFYRVKNFKGGAIRFNVHSSQGVVGTLTNGSFLYTQVEPGQHTLRLLLGDHLHIPHDPPVTSDVITITVE